MKIEPIKIGPIKLGNIGPISIKLNENDGPETIEEAAEDEYNHVSDAIKAKREHEKAILDNIDMGFYFSVVFATRNERDEWLAKHGLTLRQDDHILGSDIDNLIKR
jgi:hypothetical protein